MGSSGSNAQHITGQHNTAQHNTTQHNTTQHNTTGTGPDRGPRPAPTPSPADPTQPSRNPTQPSPHHPNTHQPDMEGRTHSSKLAHSAWFLAQIGKKNRSLPRGLDSSNYSF